MRILVVVGHPLTGSLTHALAAAYAQAARTAGAEVRVHDLAVTPFPHDPASRADLRAPDGDTTHLDPAVAALVDDVRWAEHLVVLHPQWWGTYPAVLKAYLDRVMLSGVTFRYRSGSLPTRLMQGRTARTVMTMDSPGFWNRFAYRDAAGASLGRATLAYCGYRLTGRTTFAKVRFSSPEQRTRWLATTARLGTRDAARRGASRPSAAPVPA